MFASQTCTVQTPAPTSRNSDASLFVSRPPNHVPYAGNNIDENDDDNDHAELGGSLRQPIHTNDAMIHEIDDTHETQTSVQNPHNMYTLNANPASSAATRSTTGLASTRSGTHHFRRLARSRAATRDLADENDGRRVRLALEGDALESGSDQRWTSSSPNSSYGSTLGEANAPPLELPRWPRVQTSGSIPRLNANRQNRQSSGGDNTESSQMQQPLSARHETAPADSRPERDDTNDMQLDDDTLAVNHPRRYYDFADFMDMWRLRSLKDKRLPSFELGAQPSVRLGRPSTEVTRSQTAGDRVDIQGLRWHLIGPSRAQAADARAALRPSTPLPMHSHPQKPKTKLERSDERQYCFRSFLPSHKAQFQHYQLRNLVAANSRNAIFYATRDQVMQASMACPTVATPAMTLSKANSSSTGFCVTCIAASPGTFSQSSEDSVLLAGGFSGEYAVRNLNMSCEVVHSGFVTDAYNGLVTHVHLCRERRSGLLEAAFCSNDRRVRLLDIPTMQFVNEFEYEASINCASTSPDGRLRVLAGDTSEVLITDAARGTPLVTLKDQRDHGFACDWSHNGRLVAASAQDGKTIVWDARNWSKPVATLHGVVSCARSLHFTDNGALVVAENDDLVRVYDASSYDTWQDIHFFGSVAGVALIDGGNEMAIANADKTVGGLLTFQREGDGEGRGACGRYDAVNDRQRISRRRKGVLLGERSLASEVVV